MRPSASRSTGQAWLGWYVEAKLQLVIGDADPILLTPLRLPITVINGSDYATYQLGIDLDSVTSAVSEIFTDR